MKKWGVGLAASLLLFAAPAAIAQPVSGLLTFEGNAVLHITTATTTTAPKGGAGLFDLICVNTAGAAANTATIFDSKTASGTVIAVIDTTVVGCKAYHYLFSTGLTILTAATTTQADITIGYR